MNSWNRSTSAGGVVLLALMILPTGCVMPPRADLQATVPADEIAKVFPIWDPDPFLSFDPEGDPEVEGFKVDVVLASRKTGKGVPAGGLIHARMYRIDRRPGEKPARTLVREWPSIDTSDLTALKSAVLGHGYRLQFKWDKAHDDVLGRDVDIVISFEGRDGRWVLSQPKRLRVPPAAG